MTVKKKVNINVFEHEYILLTDNNEAEVVALAEKVDAMMKDISEKNPKYSQLMVAIMGALRLADSLDNVTKELEDTVQRLDLIQNEMKKPFEELNDLKQELEATREQYTRTQSEFTKTQIDLGKVSREWARVQEELRDVKTELDVARENMGQLQSKLFDSQIEQLKTKKELDELKAKNLLKIADENASNTVIAEKNNIQAHSVSPEKKTKLRSLKNINEEF